MNDELLTIKEFAERVNLSKQAIYQQLDNKLKEFVMVVENKKYLNIKALELFKKESDSKTTEQQLIEMLKNELNAKNEQITSLQKLLDQEQQLRAVDNKKYIELKEQVENKNKANEQNQEVEELKKQVLSLQQELEKKNKKGFFARLFD